MIKTLSIKEIKMKIRKATNKDLDIIADIESNAGYKWGMNKEENRKIKPCAGDETLRISLFWFTNL